MSSIGDTVNSWEIHFRRVLYLGEGQYYNHRNNVPVFDIGLILDQLSITPKQSSDTLRS